MLVLCGYSIVAFNGINDNNGVFVMDYVDTGSIPSYFSCSDWYKIIPRYPWYVQLIAITFVSGFDSNFEDV